MPHTPGPWVVFVDRGSDNMIFSVLPAGRAGEIASNIENGSDADFIATAPAMFDALNECDQFLRGIEDARAFKFRERVLKPILNLAK